MNDNSKTGNDNLTYHEIRRRRLERIISDAELNAHALKIKKQLSEPEGSLREALGNEIRTTLSNLRLRISDGYNSLIGAIENASFSTVVPTATALAMGTLLAIPQVQTVLKYTPDTVYLAAQEIIQADIDDLGILADRDQLDLAEGSNVSFEFEGKPYELSIDAISGDRSLVRIQSGNTYEEKILDEQSGYIVANLPLWVENIDSSNKIGGKGQINVALDTRIASGFEELFDLSNGGNDQFVVERQGAQRVANLYVDNKSSYGVRWAPVGLENANPTRIREGSNKVLLLPDGSSHQLELHEVDGNVSGGVNVVGSLNGERFSMYDFESENFGDYTLAISDAVGSDRESIKGVADFYLFKTPEGGDGQIDRHYSIVLDRQGNGI